MFRFYLICLLVLFAVACSSSEPAIQPDPEPVEVEPDQVTEESIAELASKVDKLDEEDEDRAALLHELAEQHREIAGRYAEEVEVLEGWEECDADCRRDLREAEERRDFHRDSYTAIYGEILNAHPDYAGTEDVLFQRAQVMERFHRPEQALPYWQRLADEFADSEQVLRAHIALGENYFHRQKWEDAKSHLEYAAASRDRTIRVPAVYALSRVHYSLQQYDRAVGYLREALSGAAGIDEDWARSIWRGGWEDFIFSLAASRSSDDAMANIEELVEETETLQNRLHELAWAYSEAGSREYRDADEAYKEAVAVFQRLLQLELAPVDALQYEVELLKFSRVLEDRAEAQEEVLASIEALVEAEAFGEEHIPRAATAEELWDAALVELRLARSEGLEDRFEFAGRLFELYLEIFEDGDRRDDATWKLGEIYATTGRLEDAEPILGPHCDDGEQWACEMLEQAGQ